MDEHELLLLGLLEHQEMHGYQLHEFLKHRLPFVSDLKRQTAYRMLEGLYRRGLVDREAQRPGRRPERMVYRLTPAGRERFAQLLRQELAAPHRSLLSGDVALLFADRLPLAERLALFVERRQQVMQERERYASAVAAHTESTPPWTVLEHVLTHLEAEIAWLDRQIDSLRRQEERPES